MKKTFQEIVLNGAEKLSEQEKKDFVQSLMEQAIDKILYKTKYNKIKWKKNKNKLRYKSKITIRDFLGGKVKINIFLKVVPVNDLECSTLEIYLIFGRGKKAPSQNEGNPKIIEIHSIIINNHN